jgi:hypothetical protein
MEADKRMIGQRMEADKRMVGWLIRLSVYIRCGDESG